MSFRVRFDPAREKRHAAAWQGMSALLDAHTLDSGETFGLLVQSMMAAMLATNTPLQAVIDMLVESIQDNAAVFARPARGKLH